MLLHNDSLFRIYFGNIQDQLYPSYWYTTEVLYDEPILNRDPFAALNKIMAVTTLMFLKQTHSAQGHVVTKESITSVIPFSLEGDYIITALPQAGIGIMTADCLPIIYFDRLNKVVAITHAGWKGSVQQIALETLQHMQNQFGTQVKHIRIFFGPSAKACCYEVQSDFVNNLKEFAFADQVLYKHTDFMTFDLPNFNRLQLESYGVPQEAFHLNYNVCTICDKNFFSCRRRDSARQMTVVCLK
jgi:YfiH family protein